MNRKDGCSGLLCIQESFLEEVTQGKMFRFFEGQGESILMALRAYSRLCLGVPPVSLLLQRSTLGQPHAKHKPSYLGCVSGQSAPRGSCTEQTDTRGHGDVGCQRGAQE